MRSSPPPGLAWALGDDTVLPGANVTLWVTDTLLFAQGDYEVHVVGNDGENEFGLLVPLHLTEPGFKLSTDPLRRWVLPGGNIVFSIDVAPQHDWTDPISLTINAEWRPPQASAGLVTRAELIPKPEVTVVPPARAWLLVSTGRTRVRICISCAWRGSADRPVAGLVLSSGR